MRVLKFSSLLLCSLCFIVKGDAQSPEPPAEGPVWVMEFIEAQPGKMLLTLGYLDDYWMRVREEEKRQGVVLNYQRFSEMRLGDVENKSIKGATPSFKTCDPNAIVLLTEYKNLNAFAKHDTRFGSASTRRALPNRGDTPVHGTTCKSRQGLHCEIAVQAYSLRSIP